MRLRYAGSLPVTFVVLGLELEPGAEFEVPDEDARPLLARGDVEEVQPPARRKAAKSAASADDSADSASAPVTEEV